MKKILSISLLFNTLFVLFGLITVIYLKEDICQKIIDRKHSADIVMFGDSHTEGGKWNSLINGYTVKRLGWGGFTTDQLKRQINLVIQYKPKYVFILCGGNDIDEWCFDLNHTVKNYKLMVDSLKSHNIHPVFQKLLYQHDSKRFNSQIDSINNCLIKFCNVEKVDFIDITKNMNDSTGLKYSLTIDGRVHLNPLGYKLWCMSINNYLKTNEK